MALSGVTAIDHYDVVVVGAGFGGAATAFFLGRDPTRRVLLIDQEDRPGVHSSGRNASLLRGPCGDHRLDPLSEEGAAFLRSPPADFAADPSFRATGSLFVDREDRIASRCVGSSEPVSVARVLEWIPEFVAEDGTAAVWTPDDGIVDVQAVLRGYLDAARKSGVAVEFGEAAEGIDLREGRVIGLRTSRRTIRCEALVLATGAWAQQFGRAAGSSTRFRPTRRHVGITVPVAGLREDMPYVWDLHRGFYFRPEQGGLLVCACDESDSEAGDCRVSPSEIDALHDRFSQILPRYSESALQHCWAGHRTFAESGDGVWGADPGVPGLFWAAGLGGFGLTASAAIGRRAAEAVLQ